jgi:hypothetical protein
VRAGPKDAAECEWVDAKGAQNQKLPVNLDQGLVLNVMCYRTPKYEGESVSVEVTTNVGSFTGNFENVVTRLLADDFRHFQSTAMEKIKHLEALDEKMGGTIQQIQKDLHAQDQTIKGQAHTIADQGKILAQVKSVIDVLGSWSNNMTKDVNYLRWQLNMGMCRLCQVPTNFKLKGTWVRGKKPEFAGVHQNLQGSNVCLGSKNFKSFAGRIVHKNNEIGGSGQAYTPPIAWDAKCEREMSDASYGPSVVMDLCCRKTEAHAEADPKSDPNSDKQRGRARTNWQRLAAGARNTDQRQRAQSERGRGAH